MRKSRLKPKYAELLKGDVVAIAQIAKIQGVSAYTVNKWRRDQDPQLTLPVTVDFIKRYFKLGDIQITEIYDTEKPTSKIN